MSKRVWRRRIRFGSVAGGALLAVASAPSGGRVCTFAQPAVAAGPFTERVAGTSVSFEMVPVAVGDDDQVIWMSKTEVTWDLYDIFVFHLDEEADNAEADAVSRPSKPYVPPDRGFGHAGYPAMGMTHYAAEQFCDWLSAKTGRRYRLATEDEWSRACLAGSEPPYSFDEATSTLSEVAWFDVNSEFSTHPVGRKAPNAWGLEDMHGNVAEWVVDGEGKAVACGGSYKDEAEECTASSRKRQTSAWNASDPQFPKSRWWLADCGFVGMRLVCETGPAR